MSKRVIVAVKRALDYNVKVRIKPDGSGVDNDNQKFSINPFDEIACEEAVRLKESGVAKEVIAVSVGPTPSQEILRFAMALGADKAIHVLSEKETQPLTVAKALKAVVEREKPDLVLLGKQAIDDDAGQTGQKLAALLGWSQGVMASKVTVEADSAVVQHEIDGGSEDLRVKLPTVISADLRLNTPRFVKLPNIVKARKQPIDTIKLEDLGLSADANLKTVKVSAPQARQGGGKVTSTEELVQKMKATGLLK